MSENFTPEEVEKMAFEAYNTSTVPAFMAMTDAALIDAARRLLKLGYMSILWIV